MNHDTTKAIVGFGVGSAAASVAYSICRNSLSTASTRDKILVYVGSFAIAQMVGRAAIEWTHDRYDEVHNIVKAIRTD